jgi:hypothetical protein
VSSSVRLLIQDDKKRQLEKQSKSSLKDADIPFRWTVSEAFDDIPTHYNSLLIAVERLINSLLLKKVSRSR